MDEKEIAVIIGRDEDVKWFFKNLTEKPPQKVMELGAWDEDISYILSELGFDVTGVDLHEYDRKVELNHKHVIGDFCTMDYKEEFDIVVSTSAIEHFGLRTYSEKVKNEQYDSVALRKIWEALKDDGVAYITVPYGKKFVTMSPDWRVYNNRKLLSRLLPGFEVEKKEFFMSGDGSDSEGNPLPWGSTVSLKVANKYDGSTVPHLTVGLKLRKNGDHVWSKNE